MGLQERLLEDMKAAMKSKDETRLKTLRSVRAEILKREKEKKGTEIDDAAVTDIIQKQVKQREDSIQSFKEGGRDDLVQQESAELEVLKGYLPEEMDEEELQREVNAVIEETGASSAKDMGSVMKTLLPRLQESGKLVDNRKVSQLVKERLS